MPADVPADAPCVRCPVLTVITAALEACKDPAYLAAVGGSPCPDIRLAVEVLERTSRKESVGAHDASIRLWTQALPLCERWTALTLVSSAGWSAQQAIREAAVEATVLGMDIQQLPSLSGNLTSLASLLLAPLRDAQYGVVSQAIQTFHTSAKGPGYSFSPDILVGVGALLSNTPVAKALFRTPAFDLHATMDNVPLMGDAGDFSPTTLASSMLVGLDRHLNRHKDFICPRATTLRLHNVTASAPGVGKRPATTVTPSSSHSKSPSKTASKSPPKSLAASPSKSVGASPSRSLPASPLPSNAPPARLLRGDGQDDASMHHGDQDEAASETETAGAERQLAGAAKSPEPTALLPVDLKRPLIGFYRRALVLEHSERSMQAHAMTEELFCNLGTKHRWLAPHIHLGDGDANDDAEENDAANDFSQA